MINEALNRAFQRLSYEEIKTVRLFQHRLSFDGCSIERFWVDLKDRTGLEYVYPISK